jgi:adenylylsulfate kinase-like enzyme
MQTSVPVVVVTGTIGVGKTAIAMTMSEILHERGIRHGLLEVDWLGEVYPAPYPDDPYSTRFAMKNLAAIWPNFLEVGITRAIVAMTLENHQELGDLVTALGSPEVTVVRLEASPETCAERIRRRELGNLLDLFLEKSTPLAAQMECFKIGDLVVDNENRTPQAVADEILRSIRWL